MFFTHHAKNRARLHSVSLLDVERIAEQGKLVGLDDRGNSRLAGWLPDGRRLVVVLALDNPNLVITLFERS